MTDTRPGDPGREPLDELLHQALATDVAGYTPDVGAGRVRLRARLRGRLAAGAPRRTTGLAARPWVAGSLAAAAALAVAAVVAVPSLLSGGGGWIASLAGDTAKAPGAAVPTGGGENPTGGSVDRSCPADGCALQSWAGPLQPAPAATAPLGAGAQRGCAPGALRLSVSTNSGSYPASATVHLAARLTNAGTSECTVAASASTPDFTVSDAAGIVVWADGCSDSPDGHPVGGMACPEYVVVSPLTPGGSVNYSQDWAQQADATDQRPAQQVAPGSYQVSAMVDGVSASVTFTVR